MKGWEKAVAALAGVSFAYVFWYDVIQCPACRTERNRAAGRRAYDRHRARHTP